MKFVIAILCLVLSANVQAALTVTLGGVNTISVEKREEIRRFVGYKMGLPIVDGVQSMASLAQVEAWMRQDLIEQTKGYSAGEAARAAVSAVQPIE